MPADKKELKAAKKKGHTHAAVHDRVIRGKPIEHKIISTHKGYEAANKARRNGQGNAVYPLDELLR